MYQCKHTFYFPTPTYFILRVIDNAKTKAKKYQKLINIVDKKKRQKVLEMKRF